MYNSEKCPLLWPKSLFTDGGIEFFGKCKELMEQHKVKRQIAKSKDTLAHCNRFMHTVEEKYIPLQYAQEILLPLAERSRVLVKILNKILIKIANTINCRTGLTPIEAIKKKNVYRKLVSIHHPIGFQEKILPSDTEVRYLLLPGKLEGGFLKKRAGDLIWSPHVYTIDSYLQKEGQPVLYWLCNGPKRSFVQEKLLIEPPDCELPPKYILNTWSKT